MKKFLRFIWELFGPIVGNILIGFVGFLAFGWVLSFFGLMFLFMPETPMWLKWTVGIFDSLCIGLILYGWIHDAWQKVYKQN